MSFKLSKENKSNLEILKIKEELYLIGKETDYGPGEAIEAYYESLNSLYIPLYYSQKFSEYNFTKTSFDFLFGFKNDDQKSVYKQALQQLNQKNSTFLCLHTGFGKTFLGIKLGFKTKLKVGILVHRKILIDQWIESINKFTTAKVQIVKSNDPLDPEADYYIFNIAYVSKIWDTDSKCWKPRKIGKGYPEIGTLIVDEAHAACASEMCKALFYFQPKYTIGLSATPYRNDGLDHLLNLYFNEEKIVRVSETPFTVYRYPTKIKPEFKKNVRGKKDWNSVIDFLCKSEKRNKMIVDTVLDFPNKTIMIMSKRKEHCDLLSKLLINKGVSVTVMKGTDSTYSRDAQVLISTFSKLGVGFDDSRLDMLILASDVVKVEQYAGRLRYSEGKERIIIDFVDDDCSCQSHWRERRKWYLSRKGEIKNYPNIQKQEDIIIHKRLAKRNISD